MLGKDLKVFSSRDFPNELPKLNELYDSLFAGGKGFRGQLVAEMADLISLSSKEKHLLSQTIEFIHNSSLLHDDLIDQSELRRGKTAAWKEFGAEYAVLAGDYLLARVMVNLSKQGHLGLVQTTAEAISDLLEGEWLQDSIRFADSVSVGQVRRIHELKTSSLFSWCLKSPFIYKDYSDEVISHLDRMGLLMGVLLQRSDDLLDFNIRNYEGKTNFTDLKAGFLNSFSILLFQDIPSNIFYKVHSQDDLEKIISKEKLNSTLKAFDEENEYIIETVVRIAKDLVVHHEVPAQFLTMIEKMVPRIYWRK